MNTLQKDKWWKFAFDATLKAMHTSWTGKGFEEDIFREKVILIAQKVKELKPSFFIANTLNFHFTITPELQDWHNKNLFPAFKKVGLKKMAIVVPKDLFAYVSIEQTYDEYENSYSFTTQYFESEENAMEWIKAKE